ncbi:MAG: hypothetical protein PXZ07_00250 [Candidatus Eremiobacteraeota bacterium]|nr:hypothetical protein [Candidatus Eremiobacteraeota bacterium]
MMIHQNESSGSSGEVSEIASAVAARKRWLPVIEADLVNLERAILRHEGPRVHELCRAIEEEGGKLGSQALAPLIDDVERYYDAADTKSAVELTHDIEARLQSVMTSIDRHIGQFSRAAAAYRRAQEAADVAPHRLFTPDIHRFVERFGGDFDAAYGFVRNRALPELQRLFLDLRSAMRRGAREEVSEHCERIREIATTIGARRVLAEINLVERSYAEGHANYADAFYRDALQELQAVSGWLSERRDTPTPAPPTLLRPQPPAGSPA